MSPDFTISFMPSDFEPGLRLADIKGRPLFDGKSVCAKKTHATASSGGEFCKFFLIDGKSRPASRLRFFYLDIRNKPSDDKFMHGVYMNVQSSHNTVAYNNVLRVSGDAMKVRHYSNYNVILHNIIRDAGVSAFLDWPEGGRKECFSWENVFRHNEIHCGYGGTWSEVIKLRPPPEPDGGNPLCVAHGSRVLASDNSNSCP